MNILILASHAVAEYDDLRMFTDLGYDVFAPGGYEVPSSPGEGLIRPPLPEAPHHPELVARLHETRERLGEPGYHIDWGKAQLHQDIIDWADVIICHHFPERWIGGQWERIRDKRVIWRTCGQSDPRLEGVMQQYAKDGLQIVRYSPKERHMPDYAGEDALIRFGKYPADYGPWIGDWEMIGNVTQDMVSRGDATGLALWVKGVGSNPAKPAGKGSEMLGGVGQLSYPDMLDYLRHIRVYFYTGTRPAPYTLGLMEAMLSGTPVVSVSAEEWGRGWGGAPLFEGDEIVPKVSVGDLLHPLKDRGIAEELSAACLSRALDLFDVAKVGRQWTDFLGAAVPARELVSA